MARTFTQHQPASPASSGQAEVKSLAREIYIALTCLPNHGYTRHQVAKDSIAAAEAFLDTWNKVNNNGLEN